MNDAAGGMRFAAPALLLVLGLTVLFGASRFFQPFHLTTDLNDLAPALSRDADLQRAVDAVAGSIQNRFIVALAGPDRDVLDGLGANLMQALGDLPGVAVITPAEQRDYLVGAMAPYRFNLLTAAQRALLEAGDGDAIVDRALAGLYGLAPAPRLLEFAADPLGWYSEYLAETGSALAIDGDGPGNPDAASVFVIHGVMAGGALDGEVQGQLLEALSEFGSLLNAGYPEVRMLRSGVVFHAAHAASRAKTDINRISTLSLAGIAVLLLAAFLSLRPMVLPFLSVAVGIGFGVAVTHLVFGSLHILTLVFGASLIGVVVDYALHFSYHRAGGDGDHAALGRAMVLSLMTSLTGYAALGLAGLDALARVAVFSCAGLVAAWLTVTGAGDRILGDGLRINPRLIPPLVGAIDRVAGAVARWTPLLVLIPLGLATLLMLRGVPPGDDPRYFFSTDAGLAAEEAELARRIGSREPGRYFLVRGDDMNGLYRGLADLRSATPAGTILGINDWLPAPEVQLLNHGLQAALFRHDGAVAKLVARLGLPDDADNSAAYDYLISAGEVADPLALFGPDQGVLPSLVFPVGDRLYGAALITDAAQIGDPAAIAERVEGAEYIDTAGRAGETLRKQRQTAQWMLLTAFVLVALLMLARYRHPGALAMLLVPACGVLGALTFLGLTGTPLTLFHVMALFLVLGLGMDYVIFSVEMRAHPDSMKQAVFLSAVTSLLAFGLLALSDTAVVRALGATVLVGNTLNLLGALVLARRVNLSPAAPAPDR